MSVQLFGVLIQRCLRCPSVAINSGVAGDGESERKTTNINSALFPAANTTSQPHTANTDGKVSGIIYFLEIPL